MDHYFTQKPTSKLKIETINVSVFNKEFELYTASGLFSLKKLDDGTKLLIENSMIRPGWKILDLGCGYGAVGILLKLRYKDLHIIMSDINERAILISKKNIDNQKLEDIKAIQCDAFSKIPDKDFDSIIFNPPQTAGKKLCFDMITKSKDHLKKGGILQIVARHNKGGKTLSKHMEDIFGNVEDIAKGKGFRVYISKKE